MKRTHLSCSFIEKGLVFSPDGLYFCCLPLHGYSGWPFIGSYAGGPVPLELVKRKRDELKGRINAGEACSCSGCDCYLARYEEEPAGSFMFNSLVANHYTHCNIRCDYCCWTKAHAIDYGCKNYDFLPALKFLLEGGHMDPNGLIAWGGGEPALLKEFAESMAYLKESFPGVKNDIYSNATILSEPILEALKLPGNSLMCSVDAGFPGTYSAMKRHDLLSKVWDNLEAYSSAGARLMIKYIVTPANNSQAEFEAFVKEASKRKLLKHLFMADVSFESSAIPDEIVQGVAALGLLLEEAGANVLLGVHGNHTLPRQMIRSRAMQWKELLSMRKRLDRSLGA